MSIFKTKQERLKEQSDRVLKECEDYLGSPIEGRTLKYFYILNYRGSGKWKDGEGEAFVALGWSSPGTYKVGISSGYTEKNFFVSEDREAAEAYFMNLWEKESSKGNATEIQEGE